MKSNQALHHAQSEPLESRRLFSAIRMLTFAPRLEGEIESITPFNGGQLVATRNFVDQLERLVFVSGRGKTSILYTAPDTDHHIGQYMGTLKNRAIFYSDSNGLGDQQELLASDGTTAGTGLLKALPSSNFGGLMDHRVQGKYIYFAFRVEIGQNVFWRTDGTSAGTRQVVALDPNFTMSDSSPYLYSTRKDKLAYPQYPRIVVSRIDLAGQSVKLAQFEGYSTDVENITPTANGVYFSVSSNDDNVGVWYQPNGGLLAQVFKGSPINQIAVSGSKAIFLTSSDKSDTLYVTDGTAKGTQLLTTLGPGSFNPAGNNDFQAFNGGVFFNGKDNAHGVEPWFSDGTPSGTRRLADLRPGVSSSNPQDFQVIGQYLYFTATLKSPAISTGIRTDYVSHLFRCNSSGQIQEIEPSLNVGTILSRPNDNSLAVAVRQNDPEYDDHDAKFIYRVNADLSAVRVRVLFDQDQNGKGIGISGYKVVVDLNGNGIAESTEQYVISGQDGIAEIGGINRTGRVNVLVQPMQNGQTLGQVQSAVVSLSPLKTAELRFSVVADIRPISIRGVLYRSLNQSSRRKLNDTPLARTRVYLDGNGNQKLDTGELTVITDSRGRYAFSSVPIGHYKTEISSNEPWVQFSQESVDAVPGVNVVHNIVAFPGHRFMGIIYFDKNKNNVFDAGDQRMKHYNTRLVLSIPNSQPSLKIVDIFSNAQGKFQIDVVPPRFSTNFFISDTLQYEKGYLETPSYVGDTVTKALGKTVVYDAITLR